jgi:hypothetical protein
MQAIHARSLSVSESGRLFFSESRSNGNGTLVPLQGGIEDEGCEVSIGSDLPVAMECRGV